MIKIIIIIIITIIIIINSLPFFQVLHTLRVACVHYNKKLAKQFTDFSDSYKGMANFIRYDNKNVARNSMVRTAEYDDGGYMSVDVDNVAYGNNVLVI